MKIGIPSTLFGAYHLAYWYQFITLSGMEAVLSDESTKEIADQGGRLLPHEFLHQLGYKIKVMVFDSPSEDFKEFLRQCRELGNRTPLPEVVSALNLVIRLVYASDYFQQKINHLRPYEQVPGTCSRK